MTAPLTYHDVIAEQRALGCFILRPDLAQSSGLNLADMDETRGHHVILGALLDQAERCIPGSFQLLVSELQTSGQLRRCGDGDHQGPGYLLWLRDIGQQSIPQDAEVARQSIKTASVRRQIAELGTRLAQVAASNDPDDMLSTASELSVQLDMAVNDNDIDGDRPLAGLRSVGELLAMPEEPHKWIIPGLLARKERVILISGEGNGKSVLSRQVGACVAAGLHPFVPGARYEPSRVLLVDLENPPDIVRRNLARHVMAVGGLDAIGDRYHVWNWPSGLDVRSPAGRSMLVRAIEQTKPDLVLIGPLYKMADPRVGEGYEEQAARTAKALDGLRERYGIGLWIEGHMAKGKDGHREDPIGSSLWKRWPEFGIRMDDGKDNLFPLGRFRRDREERHWPQTLIRGAPGQKFMWRAMYDDIAVEKDVYDACAV